MNDVFRVKRHIGGLAWVAILLAARTAHANDGNSAGALLGYELVGHVLNVSASQSLQYGYLNAIAGLDTIATQTGSAVSESTALFGFFNDTTTQQVINNGPIRVIDRTGSSTIYFNASGGGNFNEANSFRTGRPIQTCSLRHQVVIDTSTGYFTATFEMRVTAVRVFEVKGVTYRLGKPGQVYRWSVYGKLTQQAPPSAQIVGFASGIAVEVIDN